MSSESMATPSGRPVHGGIRPAQLRELGLDPADVLDFSASISPLGPPAGLWEAMRKVDLTAYPDPECLELREALAGHLNTDVDSIMVGNGSTELIHLLARAYLPAPVAGSAPSVLQLSPTYGEYDGACRLAGAVVRDVGALRNAAFAWDMEEVKREILSHKPSLVFVCNPNNPTGVYLGVEEVSYLAEAAQSVGALLVLDEAYVGFVEARWDSLPLLEGSIADNLVVFRSMTKDYALTGLRLGYAVATPENIGRLARLQPDWSVNGLAQVAGLVALADKDYLPAARRAVAEAKSYLTDSLSEMGFGVLSSAANFLLVEVGEGAWWRDTLMRKGIFVRDCASFGLPDCVRIGIRAMPDCQRLVAAVREQATQFPPAWTGKRASGDSRVR